MGFFLKRCSINMLQEKKLISFSIKILLKIWVDTIKSNAKFFY